MRLPLLLNSVVPYVLWPLRRVALGPRLVTEVAVCLLANVTAPRPRPYSLAADYTTWPGLTDRTFTGRHLPAAKPSTIDPPSERDVVELFRRPPGREIASTDTSVLFMFFAQWFTDSFLRTDRRDGRRNTSTQEIDFCQVYGVSERQTRLLRELRGGRLKSQQRDGQEFPPFLFERKADGTLSVKAEFSGLHDEEFLTQVLLHDVGEQQKDLFFAVGLEHGNSTIGSTALDVVFLREHNRIAAALEQEYRLGGERPSWDHPMTSEALDERVFQTTRNIMLVLLLKLVVEEYIRHIAPHDLPLVLVPGMASGKRWNRSNQIAVEFNLLYRWHSLVPDVISTDEGPVDAKVFSRDNNALLLEKGVEWVITQCSRSRAAKVCLGNTPAFLLDRKHPDWPAVEERTVSQMRAARLRSYNDYRRRFSLPPLASFADLTSDAALQQRLTDLYQDIEHLEWYVGIFAEDYPTDQFLGGLLTTMVGYDAFTQALTNPLLAPDVYNEATFTRAGLDIIAGTSSLQQIAARNVTRPEALLASFTSRTSDVPSTRSSSGPVTDLPAQRDRDSGAQVVAGASSTPRGATTDPG